MDLEVLSPPVLVDPATGEEIVDVTEKVLMTITVEAGLVVVKSKTTVLVDTPEIIDTEGAAVNVVIKVWTIPQPEGRMDGPAGRHADRPGY
jgi:hypothetical protein